MNPALMAAALNQASWGLNGGLQVTFKGIHEPGPHGGRSQPGQLGLIGGLQVTF
jgi:hypothetical protein